MYKRQVDTCIPDRIKDGYGLHEQLIDQAAEDGIDTIVTCDNGIAAADEIADARHRGMTVVLTDHHDVPFRDSENGREWFIPCADAVINPKQQDCPYPVSYTHLFLRKIRQPSHGKMPDSPVKLRTKQK